MSYDLRGQWLFTGRRPSGKRCGDLCKLIRQKAMANHCRILPCILMVMLITNGKDNNVKDSQERVSFGRDHHVLQMIPGRHPMTVCHNNNFTRKIATWNVRTMFQSGKMDNIVMEMRRLKISILGVCEVSKMDTIGKGNI